MLRIVATILVVLSIWNTTRAQDSDHLSTLEAATSAYESALASYDSGKSRDAIDELVRTARERLEAGKPLYASEDIRLAELEILYGNALTIAGRAEDAEAVLSNALDTFEGHYGKDSERLVTVISLLADARAEPHDSSAQKKLYKRALNVIAKKYGKSSLEYADLQLRAGESILVLSGDFSTARDHVRGAQKTYEKLLGLSDKRTGRAFLVLGKLEFGYGKHKRAQSYLLESLEGLDAENHDTRDGHLYARSLLVQSYEIEGKSDMATEHCVAIGRMTTVSNDQELKPIFKMGPRYPTDMIKLGKEGAVGLTYTVDEQGFVQSPEVISLEGDESFASAALDAASRFRYAPRIVNGEPMSIEDVRTMITFKIE